MVLMTGEKGLLAVMSGPKGSLSVITYFYPDNPWAERAAQRILGDLNASGHYGLFVTYMLSGVTYA